MSVILNKISPSKIFFKNKTISQIYLQKNKVFPDEVVDDRNYFYFYNTSNSQPITLTITNMVENGLNFEYSTNRATWYKIDKNVITFPTVSTNKKIYIRGVGNKQLSKQDSFCNFGFQSGLKINVGGEIASLLDYNINFDIPNISGKDYCFAELFANNNSIVNSKDLTFNSKYCSLYLYKGLFKNCVNLQSGGYNILLQEMCDYACFEMFKGCTNLTDVPKILCSSCSKLSYTRATSSIFSTTKYATYCFGSMFWGCTNLKLIPQLNFTVLASYCFNSMFSECISLTETQAGWYFPNTTLNSTNQKSCYSYMFKKCTSLIKVATAQKNTITDSYNWGWLSGCTATGATLYISKSNTQSFTRNDNYIPTNWNIQKSQSW